MQKEQRVNLLSIILVLGVLLIKFVSSFFIKSMSYTAELSDALLDIIQVAITYFALRFSRRPPDADHMFGHGKVNSLAGFIQSLLIIGLYGSISYISIKKIIFEPQYQTENNLVGIAALILTMIFVFFISRHIVNIGNETQNKSIIAQGLNFRSDFYRNLAIIIGLTVTFLFKIGWIDLILAIIVSVFTIIEGIKVLKLSVNELLDANAFAEDLIQDVKNHIKELPYVLHIDNLAIRTISKQMDILIVISIPPKVEADTFKILGSQVKSIFKAHFPQLDINTNLQINIDQIDNEIESTHDIFKIIRTIPLTEFEVSDLHNIVIDNYPTKILIQFHIRVNPNFTLLFAHKKANDLESKIHELISKIIKEKKVKVISHIETERMIKNEEDIIEVEAPSSELIAFIKHLPTDFSSIFKIEKYDIFKNMAGNSVIISILFPPLMEFKDVEKIMNKIEDSLYNCPYHVQRVLIHPEPDEINEEREDK